MGIERRADPSELQRNLVIKAVVVIDRRVVGSGVRFGGFGLPHSRADLGKESHGDMVEAVIVVVSHLAPGVATEGVQFVAVERAPVEMLGLDYEITDLPFRRYAHSYLLKRSCPGRDEWRVLRIAQQSTFITKLMMIAEEAPKRRRPNILVTGTPGTGKTTFSQLLNNSLGFTYLNIGTLIREQKLYTDWNKEFDVPEYDEDKVEEFMRQNFDVAAGGLLFDFHTPDIFPAEWVDLVIIMRSDNTVLYDRLKQRGYAEHKIT